MLFNNKSRARESQDLKLIFTLFMNHVFNNYVSKNVL
ncbi:hypothetical protein DI53_3586 [Sphingobacterium deserti]|uniref:Uncharacterized protein n=1 Tax=Sphingobacterium deserti TaxID=1229276 RepID=A0A0B8SZ15_9SPHI|nr:hypothetical protein DI53_3586 [Sphingobacterium deserti]